MSTPAVTPAEQYARFRDRQSDPEFSEFRSRYDFEFDQFQVAACGALTAGDGVLVAAPTGSGKTVVGEYAVHLALAQGRKCFYTTPIKALSNQKYGDLVRRYDAETVGLLTGDNAINPGAPIVVMTTEVLRNMLYAGSAALEGLGYVVLDEVHYLADRARGAVWEEVIIHLPESVRVVALSATVSNAEEFGDWLAQVRGGTQVIVDEHRPVPLWQHMLVRRQLLDLFTDDDHAEVNPELTRIAQRDSYRTPASRPRRSGGRGLGGHPRRTPPPYRPDIVDRLDRAGLLPAIHFIFSRAGCDAAVAECLGAGLRLTAPDQAEHIEDVASRRVADVPAADLEVLGYHDWVTGLRRGIAAHHAGMLPAFKEVVEELFAAGLVRVVFATETLALGVNMPARTVVIEKLDKWNGETHAPLTPGEYTQLTGRAGRRGIDVEGHAVVLYQPGLDPGLVAGLAGTRTYPLNSSFRPSYNMAVNLTQRVGRAKAASLLESSFAQFQADRSVVGVARRLRRAREQAEGLAAKVTCDRGDFMAYAALRRRLTDAEREASRGRASSRRVQAQRSLGDLRRGDIIKVPSGRRPGMAVVLQAPPAPGEFSPRRHADGPLVLTSGGQLRQLSAGEFAHPVAPVDRVRIPRSFSPRSAKHRRDLVSAMRSRLAGRDRDGRQEDATGAEARVRSGEKAFDLASVSEDRASGNGISGDGSTGDIADLRRRLRKHPCHGCPDREQHARHAERYFRSQREIADLEKQIGGRSHVIARTFAVVCSVLDQLGYLSGDEVTFDGRRLTRLYSELDLLAAECLRRGTWEGLNPAELAACVSMLTFESRSPGDDEPPARLPKGPVRDVLTAMTRTWAELDQLEKRHGLSFLREPDPGFVWAAYRWVRGASLEDVMESVPGLTPGDFVRSVKQLIDLLDQIAAATRDEPPAAAGAPTLAAPAPATPGAGPLGGVDMPDEAARADGAAASGGAATVAPRDRDVAATARAAIDAMRRGVVAYTMLAP
ncbi:MAG: DEAD/DEAH box helicase [Nocardiopsaceae bacterium]|nr:DEAD/DEAH box helicase [Nocardiopsaceae bacterium]